MNRSDSNTFTNNIFYGDNAKWKDTLDTLGNAHIPNFDAIFDHNCFYGGLTPPNINNTHPNTTNPQFDSVGSGSYGLGSVKGYKLDSTSHCIDSGCIISNNGGHDFWGDSLRDNKPDIGAYEKQ